MSVLRLFSALREVLGRVKRCAGMRIEIIKLFSRTSIYFDKIKAEEEQEYSKVLPQPTVENLSHERRWKNTIRRSFLFALCFIWEAFVEITALCNGCGMQRERIHLKSHMNLGKVNSREAIILPERNITRRSEITRYAVSKSKQTVSSTRTHSLNLVRHS